MKRLSLLALLSLISTLGHAQFFSNLGIKSGVVATNQNWVDKSDYLSYDPDDQFGFYLGVSTEILRKKVFSLALDFGYIQKGFQDKWEVTDENNPDGTGETKTLVNRYDFLTFSPTVKFRIPHWKFTPYGFVGPRLDYFTGSQSEDLVVAPPGSKNNLIFGASYGLGVEYKCDNLLFSIEAQHQPDLTHFIYAEPSATPSKIGFEAFNNAFMATLGIKYVLN